MLKVIKEESEKCLEIVHTILEAAILGDGTLKVDKHKQNLKNLVEQALEEYADKFEKTCLTIDSDLEDSTVKVDKERMMQVFNNLLSNAFKYSKPSSSLSISVKKNGDKYKFELCNNIDTNKIKSRGIDVSETGAIGFGLEIIQEVLKLHDSELIIKSSKEHYCSSFEII